jgi:RNase adaptor protein for sRNA GlmZ degradation
MTKTASDPETAIEEAARQYFRLVILVGPPGCGKTAALQRIAQKNAYALLNVNLELSKRLLELTRNQRSRQVERLFKDVIAAAPGDVVLLDNIEILFDTSLEVEPLRLLQLQSRNRTLVASWNGSFRDGTLTYAEPGHPEFIQFKQTDAVIIPVGSGETVESGVISS